MADQEQTQNHNLYDVFGNVGDDTYKNDDCGDVDYINNIDLSVPYFPADLEAKVFKLKRSLESWREIVLRVNSLLLWEKQWFPSAIVGGTTFIFLSLWLLDPSVLTTISILGLTATISDYFVPMLIASILKADFWTTAKDKQFEEICRAIVMYNEKITLSCNSFHLMRTTRPKMYYGCTILSLSLLAWIGNSFNNLFLTYVLVTTLLLIPGMECHGMLHKYGFLISQKFGEIAASAKTKMTQAKKD